MNQLSLNAVAEIRTLAEEAENMARIYSVGESPAKAGPYALLARLARILEREFTVSAATDQQ